MDSINIFLKIKKEETSLVTTYIDALEGVAAVRTPNPDQNSDLATLHCIVAPDCIDLFEKIIKDLSEEVRIEKA
ncbi:MAG: hypothetical protein NT030_05550 [Candidatus Saganbacteria bacterium]|nr:hypothetical protein [Candidatus Saganbacteria bacterium]